MFEGTLNRAVGHNLEGFLEAPIAFPEESLRDRQVHLGVFDADVAHVGGQERQLVHEVGPLLVPLIKPMDGKCVAKVMNARAASGGRSQAAPAPDLAEAMAHLRLTIFAAQKTKDGVSGFKRRPLFPAVAEMCLKFPDDGGRNRDQALFVEFRVPQGKGVFLKVDVFDLELDGFPKPHAASVEEEEEGSQGGAERFFVSGRFLDDLMDSLRV
jgi:hypothetical protein